MPAKNSMLSFLSAAPQLCESGWWVGWSTYLLLLSLLGQGEFWRTHTHPPWPLANTWTTAALRCTRTDNGEWSRTKNLPSLTVEAGVIDWAAVEWASRGGWRRYNSSHFKPFAQHSAVCRRQYNKMWSQEFILGPLDNRISFCSSVVAFTNKAMSNCLPLHWSRCHHRQNSNDILYCCHWGY